MVLLPHVQSTRGLHKSRSLPQTKAVDASRLLPAITKLPESAHTKRPEELKQALQALNANGALASSCPNGDSMVRGFLKVCDRKFGNVVGAWRRGLDLEGKGRVKYGDFRRGCRLLGYAGNVKGLWLHFERNNLVDRFGYVTLQALDASAFEQLTRFRDRCTDQLGSLEKAFEDPKTGELTVSIDKDAFHSLCKYTGYSTRDQPEWQPLFKLLDVHSVGSIGVADVRFLQGWGVGKCQANTASEPTLLSKHAVPPSIHWPMEARHVKLVQLPLPHKVSPSVRPLKNEWNDRHHVMDTPANKEQQILHYVQHVDTVSIKKFKKKIKKRLDKMSSLPVQQFLSELDGSAATADLLT